MPHITTLSERRKADRSKMVSELLDLAERLGAAAHVTRPAPSLLRVHITTTRGLEVSVELDGKSIQPDVHVVPWHMHYDSDEKLNAAFGEVNPHHFRKATQVAYGWEQLRANIERALSMVADGSAFQATVVQPA